MADSWSHSAHAVRVSDVITVARNSVSWQQPHLQHLQRTPMYACAALQVVPVVSLNGSGNPANGRQTLATPAGWPVPPNWAPPSMLPPHHDNDPRLSGYAVDENLGNAQWGNGPYSEAVTIVGGRRLSGSNRRLLTGARITDAAAPTMAPVQQTAVKPGKTSLASQLPIASLCRASG